MHLSFSYFIFLRFILHIHPHPSVLHGNDIKTEYYPVSWFEMRSFEVTVKTAGAFLNGHNRSLEDEMASFEVIGLGSESAWHPASALVFGHELSI